MVILLKTAPTMMTELAIENIRKNYFKTNIKEIYPEYKTIENKQIINTEVYLNKLTEYLKDPPFLGEYKLILCYMDKFTNMTFNSVFNSINNFLETRKDKDNYTIILISDNKKLFNYVENSNLQDYSILNINQPPEWLLNEYLTQQLPEGINTKAALTLANRLQYRFNMLDFYLTKLQMLNRYIEEKDVKRIIKKEKPQNLFKLVEFTFGYSDLPSVLENIEKYKYANKFLFRYLDEKIKLIIRLKKDYLKNKLSFSNIEDYKIENKLQGENIELYMEMFVSQISLKLIYQIYEIFNNYRFKSIYGFLLCIEQIWRNS